MYVFMFVTSQNTSFCVPWRPLVKECFLILAWQLKKEGSGFISRLLKCAFFDQPTAHSGGVSRGRSVAVAVSCWIFALQRHFNGISKALPRHFYGTHKKVIGAFIHIG